MPDPFQNVVPNRLAHETSPYLRQHAHNPVDWYPWGEEALERARAQNKPILLSVGYSACHWCHVMAHESFEDADTAHVMNELFVNIKVDREERPDIDRIYQIAQQMLTQRSGGWPLTMFLTHDDHRPFFGGTYFPKEARHGLPAFKELLRRVAEYYAEHQPDLRAQNDALMAAFAELNPPAPARNLQLTSAPIEACREVLARTFDKRFGGFGGAPKFPHPKSIEQLMRDWHATVNLPEPDLHALFMATLTLRRMGEGGIYDQLGGGFARYSVDEYWMIPHFEKMLYDNGALLAVYADAAVATGDAFYARIAAETAEWAIREMQSPAGGFYSSFDADSEGHEGKFYVWDREAVRNALTAEEYAAFAPRFGLDREPNFEGRWHLHIFQPVEHLASQLGREPAEIEALVNSARAKLLALRSTRTWPGRDDKILTSWNALMIRGLAVAGRALGRQDFIDAATRALEFVRAGAVGAAQRAVPAVSAGQSASGASEGAGRGAPLASSGRVAAGAAAGPDASAERSNGASAPAAALWHNGRLLATYKDGHAHLNAYLDDYVYLADAVLELQQARFRADELEFAQELLETVLRHFSDTAAGGFFFTSDDHESLIHRSKSFGDDATPAGNGIAAFVLQRMGHLLGEPRYLAAAEQTIRAAWPVMEKYPHAHTTLVIALEELLTPAETVILRGDAAEIESWRRELARIYAPRRLVLAVPADAQGSPPALSEKAPRGSAVAYVCRGSTCSAPMQSLSELVEELRKNA